MRSRAIVCAYAWRPTWCSNSLGNISLYTPEGNFNSFIPLAVTFFFGFFFVSVFFCWFCIDREQHSGGKKKSNRKKSETKESNVWWANRARSDMMCERVKSNCVLIDVVLLSMIRHFNHVHGPNILAKLMKNWWGARTGDDVTGLTYRLVHREIIKQKQHRHHRFAPWITV